LHLKTANARKLDIKSDHSSFISRLLRATMQTHLPPWN